MGTFIYSCSQSSYTKIKGHVRSSCKIGWKCENGFIWKVEVQFEPNFWSRSDVNLHHPQTAAEGDTSDPRTVKYFFVAMLAGASLCSTKMEVSNDLWVRIKNAEKYTVVWSMNLTYDDFWIMHIACSVKAQGFKFIFELFHTSSSWVCEMNNSEVTHSWIVYVT